MKDLDRRITETIRRFEREILDHEEETVTLRRRVETATTFMDEIMPHMPVADTSRSGTVKEEITQAIWRVLKDERPLHRSEILARVKRLGIYVSGEANGNGMDSIAPHLTQDRRFMSLDGRGTWTSDGIST